MAGKKVRSAKGQMVDFDLLKIKEQIASDPAPLDVIARQDHIDQRMRRRLRTVKRTPIASPVDVQPALPSAGHAEQQELLIDEKAVTVEEPLVAEKPVTKQKARQPKNNIIS